MAIHKIIEVSSQSTEGWEDAARKAVAQASQSVNNIKSIYVKEMTAEVDHNQVNNYRLIGKITFEVQK
jgi:flavin-binding protein dodecin